MIYIYAENNMEKATAVAELKSVLGDAEITACSDQSKFRAIAGVSSSEDYCLMLDEIKRKLPGKATAKYRYKGESASAFVQRVCTEEKWGQEELSIEKTNRLYDLSVISINRLGAVSEEEVKAVIKDCANSNFRFAAEDQVKVVEDVFKKLRGYGVLEDILINPAYSEIMVNGLNEILVEENGRTHGTGISFASMEDLMNVVRRLALDGGGKSIDEAHPLLDAELIAKDGSRNRVNIVLSCIAKEGPFITIRKKAAKFFTLEDLVKEDDAREFLMATFSSGYNTFISGGTGSGKTTLLNALAQKVSDEERVVIIEDTPEISIEGKENNVIAMETRLANSEDSGAVTCQMLIRNSLRMRPDRIIVGEVRGAEVVDMLQAMNTGHDGSLSTGHANSGADMVMRLETMAITEKEIPARAIRSQIASAINLIVHVSRMRDGSRRITEINEVQGIDKSGDIKVTPMWEFKEDYKKTSRENVVGKLERTSYEFLSTQKLCAFGYTDAEIVEITKNKENEYEDVIISKISTF